MYILDSDLGRRPVARCDALGCAPFSEEPELLNRPYLTPSHKEAIERVKSWMLAAKMSVRLDAVGNLIGRYEALEADAPALLIGSHIDTVHGGGRYDGALGVMLGIECVQALADQGLRLPFAVEVIAFGDEEGSRFPASMLCSRAIVEGVANDDLRLLDQQGVALADALATFGLDPSKTSAAVRRPGDLIGYVEAHIEQGPVLEDQGLPIGVVTGIAAQLRLKAKFKGVAGHAGTSPMGLRADAVAAAAEAVLVVERICREGPPDLRGTVGRFISSTTAYNVIAGEAEIGIDVRAATDAVRDEAADRIREELFTLATRRGIGLAFSVVQNLAACPCDPALTDLMARAVETVGVKPYRLLSGAGHDALVVAALTPVAMLFVRCENGVSHNADERVAAADVDCAVRALVRFLEQLAETRR